MFKEIGKRFLLGFIYGVFVIYLLALLTSFNIGDGNFHFITSGLQASCKTELGAAALQFFLAGFLGVAFGVTTIFWEIDKWSLARQTITHFFVITISMLIVAYFINWMPHTLKGFAMWTGMFVVVYLVIWTVCYNIYKRTVKDINKKLAEKKDN